ncbi:MAG: cellulase family glycosylhydrolase, partial [Acidimicrobiales bacterium]
RRWAAGLVVVGMGVTLSGVPVSPAAAATTSAGPAIGVVGDITWGISQADIDRSVASMAAAGVGWVRANMSWSGGEPDAKGVLNEGWLVQIDYAVKKARAAGIKVLMPIADGVPYWASADPAKYSDASGNHWNKYWRPSNEADYADFVRAMVGRYQALGVHTYEVWNEPNTSSFWPSGPSATEYTALLAAAYPAIKTADPTATVVLGGLSKNDYDYLAQLYAAGAGNYFDVVAVHPYTGTADPTWCWNQAGTTKLAKDAFCGIEEVHNTMVANGDSDKRIWLTEFGWSTTTGAYGVSEATQAQFLTEALNKIKSSYPYVQTAFWYNFRNNFWLNDAPADYEANLGLLRVDFSAKPAYAALKSWTGVAPAPAPSKGRQRG